MSHATAALHPGDNERLEGKLKVESFIAPNHLECELMSKRWKRVRSCSGQDSDLI